MLCVTSFLAYRTDVCSIGCALLGLHCGLINVLTATIDKIIMFGSPN